jgi:hypothetical protein
MASENKGKLYSALLKSIPGMTQKASRGIASHFLNRGHLRERKRYQRALVIVPHRKEPAVTTA